MTRTIRFHIKALVVDLPASMVAAFHIKGRTVVLLVIVDRRFTTGPMLVLEMARLGTTVTNEPIGDTGMIDDV
jgi:hypothetical protein